MLFIKIIIQQQKIIQKIIIVKIVVNIKLRKMIAEYATQKKMNMIILMMKDDDNDYTIDERG